MSASPVPERDDWMDVAEAVNVTPMRAESIRVDYSDAEFAHVMANFTRLEALANEPIPYELTNEALGYCGHCGGSGLAEHRSALTGAPALITCPVCKGES
ncbi:hypothetical protein [Nocardioides lijunqiniae]|uniref:hypothetical protein n=1 Tax=Nocardioides lijunqiniae TaxID=2760832 RepID=UPI0018779CE5|nr:hypothetical protein [Nocardioides lijunqiniae]